MNEDFCYDQIKEWSLDDFEIGDKLGKGAFGDVFIAREKQLGFMCVLKKMSKKRIK
jgi:aurora kinase